MKLKSVTFRCSEEQQTRLCHAMNRLSYATRTELLACALEDFLHFVEQEDVAALDLFELVQRINQEGSARDFAQQACRR